MKLIRFKNDPYFHQDSGFRPTWWERLATRIVCNMLYKARARRFQMWVTDIDDPARVCKQASGMVSVEQIQHWLLREAGYECNTTDVLRFYGRWVPDHLNDSHMIVIRPETEKLAQ